jgi:hypothetical protein
VTQRSGGPTPVTTGNPGPDQGIRRDVAGDALTRGVAPVLKRILAALSSLAVGASLVLVGAAGSTVAAPVGVAPCAVAVSTTYVRTTTGMTFEDRAGGSHALTASGLSIAWSHADLSLSKSAGYLPVSVPFESAGVPAWEFVSTSGASAGLNLTLAKNGSWFGNLVFEPLFDQYWINKAVPGMPAGPNPSYQLAYGTLDEFLEAFGDNTWDVDIVAIGYSGGSGSIGAGVVKSLTVGCDRYVFQAATNATCTASSTLVVTTLAALDLTSTRADGHNAIVDGALHVWTGTATGSPDPRKAAGYLDVPDFPLTRTGTVALGWTGSAPPPGGQIVVDLDGNGSADGILVFEAVYGQNLWLASIAPGFVTTGAPAVGGGGGAINGTIDQYLAKWPDAKGLALGYSLGSGVTGDGLLTLIQAGCLRVTFDLPAAAPPAAGGTTTTTPRATTTTPQLTTLPFSGEATPTPTPTPTPQDDEPEAQEPTGETPTAIEPTSGEGADFGWVVWLGLGGAAVLGLAVLTYIFVIRPRGV